MMLVNIVALTLLTRGSSRHDRAQRGAILNVSSCASFLPMADLRFTPRPKPTSPVSPKRCGANCTDGCDVTALCPGPVRDGIQRSGETAEREQPNSGRNSFTWRWKKSRGLACAEWRRDAPIVIPGLGDEARDGASWAVAASRPAAREPLLRQNRITKSRRALARVFNGAAVGFGVGIADWFARHRFVERDFHVVG